MDYSSKKRVLIVDDEPDVTELLSYNLKKEFYEVESLHCPLEIMSRARDFMPHLFILDVMMPELNGIQACRMIRADRLFKETPIIFLTARGEAEDRIKGLESGADDYLTKPFEIKELVLRVKTIFRRMQTPLSSDSSTLCIGSVILDESRHKVTVKGEEIAFTATEFKLLHLLMKRKGRVQSRDNLLFNVWDYDTEVETRTVDTHIRRLREKLGSEASFIETIRGIGYRVIDK